MLFSCSIIAPFWNICQGKNQVIKSHSYIRAKFKCDDFDFVGENYHSMDVHIVKSHSDNYECGLCDLKMKTSENKLL